MLREKQPSRDENLHITYLVPILDNSIKMRHLYDFSKIILQNEQNGKQYTVSRTITSNDSAKSMNLQKANHLVDSLHAEIEVSERQVETIHFSRKKQTPLVR